MRSTLLVLGIAVTWRLGTIQTDLPPAIWWLFTVLLGVQLADAVCRGMLALCLRRAGSEAALESQPAPGPGQGRPHASPNKGQPAVPTDEIPSDAITNGEQLVICCSGGGIKSASFCLGALQHLDEAGIYSRASRLVGVSGGGYAATAFSLAPGEGPDRERIFGLESRALRGLRQRTNYLADSPRTRYDLVLSLALGIVVNLVAAGAALIIVARLVGEWVIGVGHVERAGSPEWTLRIIWDWTHLMAPFGPPVILLAGTLLLFLLDRFMWPDEGRMERWSSRARSGFWSQVPTKMVSLAWLWLLGFPLFILAAWWVHYIHVNDLLLSSDFPSWITWLVSSGLFLYAVNWVRKGLSTPPTTGFWRALVMQIRMKVLPRVLILLAALGAYVLAAEVLALLLSTPPEEGLRSTWVLSAAGVSLLVFRFLGSANITSLYPFYRDRLAWAFLYQECRDQVDAEHSANQEADKCFHGVPRAECTDRVPPSLLTFGSIKDKRPTLALCATANVQDPDLVPTGRHGVPFVISAKGTGLTDKDLSADGYRPLRDYCEYPRLSMHLRYLGSAMAISGAAVAPLAGRDSRQVGPFRVLLTLANIRLGVWQPNPLWLWLDEQSTAENESSTSKRVLARVWRVNRLLNQATTAHVLVEASGQPGLGDPNLYLTDGGHYDNLGLVEALRTRPDRVIVLDGSGDPPDEFPTMGRAIATARMDMGVEITFDPTPLLSHGGRRRRPRTTIVEATATWPDRSHQCHIDYVRAVLPDQSSWDLCAYQANNASFPATSDTLEIYGEFDFEAFRHLGYTAIGPICDTSNREHLG